MGFHSSDDYQKVALANKLYYEKNAVHYDKTETCITDKRFQNELYEDLKSIKSMFGNISSSSIEVLDACGGSGNAALKALDLGMRAVLCDQSKNLINIFKQKCQKSGYECRFIESEIVQYLSTTDDSYDLIVFSSALHHLEDYENVLRLALKRLNRGGFVFTIFDPILWIFPAKQIVKAEYIIFKLFNDFNDFFPAAFRRLKKIFFKKQRNNCQSRY